MNDTLAVAERLEAASRRLDAFRTCVDRRMDIQEVLWLVDRLEEAVTHMRAGAAEQSANHQTTPGEA